MIVGIILALFLGVGLLLFASQGLPGVATQAIQSMNEALIAMADKTFYFLAAVLPILCAAIPLYILRMREDRIILMGMLYGVGLMLLTIMLGLQDQVMGYLHGSWFTGWIPSLGAVADVFYALFYWIWGAALYAVDAFLTGIVMLGKPAERLKGKVKTAKEKWRRKRR